ncbi:MAG: hypothetical protein CALGDGBN_03481 [Pseudomonadales bacterium]|nr:hypothetical protein [Pseudomonadales bacterium]
MEKLIYVLWKDRSEVLPAFNSRLLGPVRAALQELGVEKLQFNIVDDVVAPGAHMRAEPVKPAPDALVSFWLNSANIRTRAEAVLDESVTRIAGYAVAESTPRANADAPGEDDRVPGFSQIAFLFKRPDITREGFMDMWMRDQTVVGMETQDSFYYCQNIVTRVLTTGAPMWDGIVEECYVLAAMTDPLVFWNAGGKEEVLKANLAREMNNVARFLDLARGSVILTSAYRCGGWADPAEGGKR